MVVADQMHADWMGQLGKVPVETPHLDRFAKTSTRFNRAYTQNSICTPSRVSILSGQYPHNHGYYGLIGPARPELNNLFRQFRSAGYRTAAYGKLHLPMDPESWVLQDLDEFGDTYEDGHGTMGRSEYLSDLEANGVRDLEDSWHNTNAYGEASIPIDAMPSKMPYEHTMEMWSARKAMRFMENSPDQPFLVQVNFQKPHHPLLPQKQFWDRYEGVDTMPPGWDLPPDGRPPHFRRRWEAWRHETRYDFARTGENFGDAVRRGWRGTLACVTQIDDVFGRLLDFLDSHNLAENTIVVFCSDHGAYHGMFGMMEKSPGICSDAVCRVPLLVRVPQLRDPMPESDALVESIDLAPTLCALADVPPMPEADGKDITPLFRGEGGIREEAVTENALSKSIRWEQWRYVHYPKAMFEGEDIGELYNIEDDPLEMRNLYPHPDFKAVVEESRNRLLDWSVRTTRTLTLHRPRENWPTAAEGMVSDRRAPAPLQVANDPTAIQEYL